ncbi:aspartyl protease-like protein [Aphelenchoides avenae]|nr:aspartyl protease-like protein [Aphelenchus avenae]
MPDTDVGGPNGVRARTTYTDHGLHWDHRTGTEYNFIYGVYTVDCDVTNLPDIVLTIGGKDYNIPSSEYVLDLGIGGAQCVIAARDGGETSPFEQPSLIPDDVFLRAYCSVYDIGQKRIGFAKAHNKEI